MTSTGLKLLALFFMLLDHIGEFIPGAPIWLHWVGRISAPVFLFCMVWGFYYTHDRKKYLLRMYLFGGFMAVLDLICNTICEKPYCYITNNIFVTLFLVAVIVQLIEYRRENQKKGNKYITLFVCYQIISTVLCVIFDSILPIYDGTDLLGALTGNILFNEGSFIFVFLGVMMYFRRDNKRKLAMFYIIFCVACFAVALPGGITVKNIIFEDYQWMMIGSLPFMLIYNGKKGGGLKYLFYIFYPLHITILFWLGNCCF